MDVRIIRLFLCLMSLVACNDDGPTGPGPDALQLHISPDSAVLILGDTLQLSAVLAGPGADTVAAAISWKSLDSTIASVMTDGRAIARRLGNARIVATGRSAADTVILRVIAGCDATGVTHRGAVNNETWSASASPHFVVDTLTVTGDLTIEAGAIVCARPGARIHLRAGRVEAVGRADRRIRFLATDTVLGWNGIVAGGSSGDPSGSIVLHYVDVEYAASVATGYLSSGMVENSTFRRTFVGNGGANFSSFSIKRSIVEDGMVHISAGLFEETVVRRGRLELIYAQPGSTITLNGGGIEDSPATAITIGSRFSYRVPNVSVVKPPEIVGSRGGIAWMPSAKFFELWPTALEQAALLNNVDRRITIWSVSFGDLRLRPGFRWELAGPIAFPTIESLVLEPGALVRIAAHARITGALTAVGTITEPITISSFPRCWSSQSVCGLTLSGTASSSISHVVFDSSYLSATEQNVVKMEHVSTNNFIRLAAAGSSIADLEIEDPVDLYFPPAGALMLSADNITAERIVVRRVSSSSVAAIAIGADNVHVRDCDITDNVGDGIVVTAGTGLMVSGCNFERNEGFGLNNKTAQVVDARGNWWGDPAGPLGPSGDGVSGPVDYTEARSVRWR